jgi:Helix-turn-helix domain/LytR cell envelope-related transcriptional attenuator
MALAPSLAPLPIRSPLAGARLQRHLSVEAAAQRAGLTTDEVSWLEDGRVYRFPSSDAAIAATLLYASALGIDHREARTLAGIPGAHPAMRMTRARVTGLTAVVAALAALVAVVVLHPTRPARSASPALAAAALPPPWKVKVDVLNGNGDIVWTRHVADSIGALAYHIRRVGRADRFDYKQTAVYYERGGAALAVRLARRLRVPTKALPGGTNALRLVVIVGPHRGL